MPFTAPSAFFAKLSLAEDRFDQRLFALERRLPAISSVRRRLVVLVFAIAALSVLLLQAYDVGLSAPTREWNHHAWVSAHNLAGMSHATWRTGFVGYSLHEWAGGRDYYDYFYRSTFVGPLVQRLLTLSFTENLSMQVFLNRQFMNLVFICSIWVGFLILRHLVRSDSLAMAASLLSFCGYYIMFYKDLIGPDNVALLGLLLAVYGILDFVRTGRKRLLYGLMLVAVSIGWGYSVLPVFAVFALYDAVGCVRRAPPGFLSRLTAPFRSHGVRAFAMATIISVAYVSYCVAVEMAVTGVSLRNSGVVRTAMKRTGSSDELQKKYAARLEWKAFSKDQIGRVKEMFPEEALPAKAPDASRFEKVLLGVLAASLLAAVAVWRTPQRLAALLLLSSGFLWLFPMRHLAAFHDYTAVCYAGVPLAAFAAVGRLLPRHVGPFALALALCFFFEVNVKVNEKKSEAAASTAPLMHDFEKIAKTARPGSKVFYDGGYDKIVKHSPYAIGFLMKDCAIALKRAEADYVVSRKSRYNSRNLTQKNREVFLFRK